MSGSEKHSMEDEIDDLEEMEEEDPEEEIAVGESSDEVPSSVMGYEPPASWKLRSARTIGLSKRRKPAEPKRLWLIKPDVLGYLNSFKDLTDTDRLRLARACANYLNNQERHRVGYFQKRAASRKVPSRAPSTTEATQINED